MKESLESQENYLKRDNFWYYVGHYKFVITIQVKVIIFSIIYWRFKIIFGKLKNLVEASDEGMKNIFSTEDIIKMPAKKFSIVYEKVFLINQI